MVSTLALYVPVLLGMVADWSRFPSQSHGFAVPAIAAYLIWMRRGPIASAAPDGSRATVAAGVAALIAALGALVIGSLAGGTFRARHPLPGALPRGAVSAVGAAGRRPLRGRARRPAPCVDRARLPVLHGAAAVPHPEDAH